MRCLLALLLTACGGLPALPLPKPELRPTVRATDCDGNGVLGETTQFRIRTFAGTSIEAEKTQRASDGVPAAVPITAGEGRRLVVEALDANGAVIAVARSGPLGVAERAAVTVALRFRPVEAFSAVCAAPTKARAGHTAVVLNDGAVWIAGGDDVGTTERFDPVTETFTAAAALAVGGTALPRAHATATKLGNGQVLLWGGEHAGAPSPAALIYDPDADAFGAIPLRVSPPAIARSRHVAVRIGTDVVAIGGEPSEVERFSPTTQRIAVEAHVVAAAGAAIALVHDSSEVLVAGGAADGQRAELIDFGSTTTSLRLATPRRWATAVKLGDGTLVAGGEGAAGGSSEWVGHDRIVRGGPDLAPRAEPCAVRLADGRVLLVGGRDAAGPVAAAELISVDRTARTLALPHGPRLHATCTLLPDDSVLVLGGGGPPLRFTPR